jgi:ATP-binding cassette subfamily C (CFTR/MRP) protein 1
MSHASDATMISALGMVSLWEMIHESGGLDSDMGDISLSAGQRQLFCLARAIVQKMQIETRYGSNAHHGGIILLDEANSNVDMETSLLMQRLLKEEFAARGWTTVVVTHRLKSVLCADKVALFDEGRIVEFDRPGVLLEAENSRFRDLYYSRR